MEKIILNHEIKPEKRKKLSKKSSLPSKLALSGFILLGGIILLSRDYIKKIMPTLDILDTKKTEEYLELKKKIDAYKPTKELPLEVKKSPEIYNDKFLNTLLKKMFEHLQDQSMKASITEQLSDENLEKKANEENIKYQKFQEYKQNMADRLMEAPLEKLYYYENLITKMYIELTETGFDPDKRKEVFERYLNIFADEGFPELKTIVEMDPLELQNAIKNYFQENVIMDPLELENTVGNYFEEKEKVINEMDIEWKERI